MSILALLIILACIGVGTWALVTFIPMSPGIKKIISIVAVVIAILLCLIAFGVLDELRGVQVPKI